MHSVVSEGNVFLLSMNGSAAAGGAMAPAFPAAAAPANAEHKHCRHCSSPSLVVDWAQGDRICTACGVIDEEHIRDDGPEWRDYANEDDNGAMYSAAARTGLVPTDETKYLGGLQPTMLSRNPYGGSYGPGRAVNGETAMAESRIRRKLLSTNRKLDKMMEDKHREQMEEARLARRVMARRRREASQARRMAAAAAEAAGLEGDIADVANFSSSANSAGKPDTVASSMSEQLSYTIDDDLSAIGREHLELAQKEEDAARIDSAAVLADKWSLDRAILLHGTHDEQRPEDTSFHHPAMGQYQHRDIEEERKQLNKKLNADQRAASVDLYRASRILLFAARELELPDRAVNEATTMLVKYAAAKDGFRGVRGISSRATPSGTNGASKDDVGSTSSKKRLAKQRDRNKVRQMTALSSAFIYLSAKKLGHGRSLKDVCASFRPEHDFYGTNNDGKSTQLSTTDESVIKPKHCSRAMTEIKILFPEYVRSVAACPATNAPNSTTSASSAANGSVASPQSSEATTSLTTVFGHRSESEINNLVEQACRKLNLPKAAQVAISRLSIHCYKEQVQMGSSSSTKPATLCAAMTHLACLAGSSMQNLATQALAPSEEPQLKRKHVRAREVVRPAKKQKLKTHGATATKDDSTKTASIQKDTKVEKPTKFDLLSHDAVEMDDEVLTKAEQETIKVWDTWYSQKSWGRDISVIADSYSASQPTVADYYKKHVHYRRKHLLELLQADSISDSAETTLLLKRIAAAAHLIG